METNERSHYIDAIKATLIFMVILGHCIQYGSGEIFLTNLEFYECFIFKMIYTFHMPAFMVISGYLFSKSCERHPIKELIVSRVRSLLVPNLAWCIIVSGVLTLVSHNSIGGGLALLKANIVYGFWYLWAVLIASIVVAIERQLCGNHGWLILFLFVLGLFTPDDYNLYLYKFMLPYFWIGYRSDGWVCTYNKMKDRRKYVIGLILVLLFVVGFVNWREDFYVYVTRISLLFNDYDLGWIAFCDLYRWIMGLIGTAVLCLVVLYVYKTLHHLDRLIVMIKFLSSNTMALYVLNVVICSYFLKPLCMDFRHNFVINFVEAVLMCILESAIISMIKRNVFLRKILLGNR